MWTRKTRLVLITVRIGLFRLPIILPMRCVHEIIEGYLDFFSPFKWISEKIYGYLTMAEGTLLLIKDYEPLDLVDIDAVDRDDNGKPRRVKIKILTR